MAISDKIRELDEQVAQAVRRAVDDLREEVRRRLDEATSELQRHLGEMAPDLPESFVSEEHLRRLAEEAAAPASEALEQAREEGRAEGLETLLDATGAIDRAGSQAEILEALLSAARRHAGRAAILLVRDGRLAGWGARGFEAEPEAVRSLALAGDDEPWSEVLAGGPARTLSGAACAPLASQLDSPLPREGCAVPLVLRDRVAAVVYADRPEDGRLDLAALQLLTYSAALGIETLAFRRRDATATLAAVGGSEAAAELALEEPAEAPPAAEAEEEEHAAAVEEGAELEAAELEEPEAEPAAEAGFEASEETWEVPAAPEAEARSPWVEEEPEVELEEPEAYRTPPHGDELLEAVEEEAAPAGAEPFDEGAFEEAALEEAPSLEAGVEEGYGAEPEAEPSAAGEAPETMEVGPAETIAWRTEPEPEVEEPELEEPEIDEPEAEEPPVEEPEAEPAELEGRPEAGEVPPPPPAPPASGGQVAPPEDVEGPGWAFSATRGTVPKDTEAAHEEARRLARLLVSEIQLYNQEQVDEGRRNRDIYERLKDDIDRSRQLYEDRVESAIRETTDYFYQELVRQLAAGDAKALGI